MEALKLFNKFKNFRNIFSEKDIGTLPAHTRYNHIINIINKKELSFNFLYNLLERKLNIL